MSHYDFRDTDFSGSVSVTERLAGFVGFHRAIFVATALKELQNAITDPNIRSFDYNQINQIRYQNMTSAAVSVGTEVLLDAAIDAFVGYFTTPLLHGIIGRFTSDVIPTMIFTNLGKTIVQNLTSLALSTVPGETEYSGYVVSYVAANSSDSLNFDPDNGADASTAPRVLFSTAPGATLVGGPSDDIIVSASGGGSVDLTAGGDNDVSVFATEYRNNLVEGGPGSDRLTITADEKVGTLGFQAGTYGGGRELYNSSSLAQIEALSAPVNGMTVHFNVPSGSTSSSSRTDLRGIEHLSLIGGPTDDLLIVWGDNVRAIGNGGNNTLYADWRGQPDPLIWDLHDTAATEATLANGWTVQGIQRLLARLGDGGNKITLNGPNNIIYGGKGDDDIVAPFGGDLISLGNGNDIVSIAGNSAVLIDDGLGGDTVYGFIAGASGNDRLDLNRLPAIRTLPDVLARGTQQASDTVFDFGGGDTLHLIGVSMAAIDAGDFIFNDDAVLSIKAAGASKPEGYSGTTPFTFTITRSGTLSTSAAAKWAVTGGSAAGTVPANAGDFFGGTLPFGLISFAPGETSKTLSLAIAGDKAVEFNESFTVTLSNPSADVVLDIASATAAVFNDDITGTGTLSIAAVSASKSEGTGGSTPFTFTVTRSGVATGPAQAKWTVTGGGVAGTNPAIAADFAGGAFPSGMVSFAAGQTSRTITVPVNGDTVIEPADGFTVTLSEAPNGVTLGTTTASGTIANDDATLSIAATSASKPEGSGATTTAYTFTVARAGDLSQPHTAKWAVTGNGTQPANAQDFPGAVLPSGTVSFAPGQTSRTVTIPVVADRLVEPTEGFRVTLSAPSGGARLGTTSASGSIANDDTAGTGTLSVARLQAARAEGQSGSTAFTFLATRTGSTTGPAVADWAVTPGSSPGTVPASAADFVGAALPTGTVSFAAGEASKVVTVSVVGDTAIELNESFALTLSNAPTGVTLGTATASGMIFTDDTPGTGSLSIARASAQRAEGHSGSTAFTFTVTRGGTTTGTASADWGVTAGGAAGTVPASAADFPGGVLPTGRVSFAAGQVQATVSVSVAGDGTAELNEGFTITLAAPQAGVAIATAAATGVILNDDYASTAANQTLTGTAAPDLFLLGGGLDSVFGKGGTDLFRFLPSALGPAVSNATTLEDFSRAAGEVIDLSAIDAIPGTLVNDAFSFIGTAQFGGVAGQLRWQDDGVLKRVQGDLNGDAVEDLTLLARTTSPLDVTWFAL